MLYTVYLTTDFAVARAAKLAKMLRNRTRINMEQLKRHCAIRISYETNLSNSYLNSPEIGLVATYSNSEGP